jgi:hypothetical protein
VSQTRSVHVVLATAAAQERIRALLSATVRNMQVYICGPGPMLDAAAGLASGHFEYCKNTRELDRSTEAMRSIRKLTCVDVLARIVARHIMVGSTSYCVPAADEAAGLTTPRTAYTSIKPGQTVKSQT